jgi:benzoyl-CoA reductase/2-hydroxyglutaryl-CoA dehydratase subunit BcrC/BadD/HgdB
VVGINTPCDSQVLSTQAMQEACGKPMFVVDVPTYEGERAVTHVARQLRDLILFLERHLGQRFSWDRARCACELSNQAVEHVYDWLDLRKQRPTMQPGKLAGLTLVLQVILTGQPLGVDLARSLAEDARARLSDGLHYYDERVRAIWYQDPVWWDFQIYDWMEAKLGLSVVGDLFGYYAAEGIIDLGSEESMLQGLARKLIQCMPMSRQFRGTMARYCEDFLSMHAAYGADCGIFAGHIACKHAWGGIGLFKEACRQAGVPLLVFDFDMFDPRVTTHRQLRTELTRFVEEVVLPRKRRGAAGGSPTPRRTAGSRPT